MYFKIASKLTVVSVPCSSFCTLAGLKVCLDEASRYWTQTFVEASLLLALYALHVCTNPGAHSGPWNQTFFVRLINAVTRWIPLCCSCDTFFDWLRSQA